MTVERVPARRRAWARSAVRAGAIAFDPRVRARLRREAEACRTPAEHHAFASRLLGQPPAQVPEEIYAFIEYANAQRPSCVCELGTQHGGTSYLLGRALPHVRLMLGVDLRLRRRRELRLTAPAGQRRVFIQGSSHHPRTVARVASALEGRPIDLLFVDADHSWTGVTQDFLAYRGLVADGGLIAFHDIVPDWSTTHGRDTPAYAGDVHLLWRALKRHYPHDELVRDPEQNGSGIGVIRYDPATSLPQGIFDRPT